MRPADIRAILPNPVEVPEQLPAFESRRANSVVFLGTLTPKKGIFALLEAWPEVVRRVPGARLEIFGKDSTTKAGTSVQAALIAGLPAGLRDSVRFHGHVSRAKARDQLLRARVGVFPSFSESFGMVAAESMAAGCPTVFTRRSCGPEILRHGEEGLLVDPEDPLEIAEAVTRMLQDDNLARKFSHAAHIRASREYRLEEVVRRNEEFYREVVNSLTPVRVR
jgi:glycosyltransferase involved in cell wall biosynthesis